MSNCNIVTGKKVHAVSRSSGSDTTNRIVLFDGQSTKTVTHVVTVAECKALKISTFALPADKRLRIHRVFTGGGVMPQGISCACGSDEGVEASVLLSEPFRINCQDVVVDGCYGTLFLTVPGDYVLELEHADVLGQFVALAEEVDCCGLPPSLVIGHQINADRIIGTVQVSWE